MIYIIRCHPRFQINCFLWVVSKDKDLLLKLSKDLLLKLSTFRLYLNLLLKPESTSSLSLPLSFSEITLTYGRSNSSPSSNQLIKTKGEMLWLPFPKRLSFYVTYVMITLLMLLVRRGRAHSKVTWWWWRLSLVEMVKSPSSIWTRKSWLLLWRSLWLGCVKLSMLVKCQEFLMLWIPILIAARYLHSWLDLTWDPLKLSFLVNWQRRVRREVFLMMVSSWWTSLRCYVFISKEEEKLLPTSEEIFWRDKALLLVTDWKNRGEMPIDSRRLPLISSSWWTPLFKVAW